METRNPDSEQPTCCEEHRNSCTVRRPMETSHWKFIDDAATQPKKKFDPWSQAMPATQSKRKNMRELEHMLSESRKMELLAKVEQFRKRAEESEKFELESEPEFVDTSTASHTLKSKQILESLKAPKPKSNRYLMLLNRLDEEKGVRMPSIEDKLKLAEDRLRLSTLEFCKASSQLIAAKDEDLSNIVSEESDVLVRPEEIHELFRCKLFDPSTRPPRALVAADISRTPTMGDSENMKDEQLSKRKGKPLKEKYKEGFHLPTKLWFVSDKQSVDMTLEEMELLNSTATKAFLKFLEHRKKEPTKVLKELKEKLAEVKEGYTIEKQK